MVIRKTLEVVLEMITMAFRTTILLSLLVLKTLQIFSVKFASFLDMEQTNAETCLILHLFLRRILAKEISEVNMAEAGHSMALAEV